MQRVSTITLNSETSSSRIQQPADLSSSSSEAPSATNSSRESASHFQSGMERRTRQIQQPTDGSTSSSSGTDRAARSARNSSHQIPSHGVCEQTGNIDSPASSEFLPVSTSPTQDLLQLAMLPDILTHTLTSTGSSSLLPISESEY